MVKEYTRRAIAAAILGGTTGAATLSPAESFLDRFAALSGSAWERAGGRVGGTVESEYGAASVSYDEFGVPTIEAEDELAGYFAIGYAHGTDRLFQMDLFRRRLRGELSEVVGELTLESDEFNRRMNFKKAAEASWERVSGTDVEAPLEAYSQGVNRAREREPRPIEFGLLEYQPEPWRPVDTLLLEKQIAWGLTGSFRTLRRATLADALDAAVFRELFPRRFDHDAPIIRDDIGGEVRGGQGGETEESGTELSDLARDLDPAEVARLSQFESPRGIGSNSWVLSGEYTASGMPLVANDPHLMLTAPPIWYEQRHEFDDRTVHGVTFAGIPFVVIGRNGSGAWGITNTNADVLDVYTYQSDGDTYQYGDESRPYELREEHIEVADSEDVTITVRETVHGPIVTREGEEVAVAWTGLTGTATPLAVYRMAQSDDSEEFLAATRDFDTPPQNLIYGGEDGGTLYIVTGRIPRRVVDGEEVYGDRIFDGSEPEGEWQGFTPYGQSSWEGFVPFDEKPAVIDPDWIGTANQRVLDDPEHPLAEGFSDPFRGIRLNERLADLTEGSGDLEPSDMQNLQRDVVDHRARLLAPAIVDAASAAQADFVEPLRDWDAEMGRDSRAALVFAAVWTHYRRELYDEEFSQRGLEDESFWPADWVTATLQADASWFDVLARSRDAVLRSAIDAAQTELETDDLETYGDLNVVDIAHPFQQEFLGYPAVSTDGSGSTLYNVQRGRPWGSSWRMVVPMQDTAKGILPGGNSGDYFDPHYADQLSLWANGQYRDLDRAEGEPAIRFQEASDD